MESKYLTFARSLKLEPYVLLFFLGNAVRSVTVTQLFQDKLCIVDYGYNREFCKELSSTDSESEEMKSEILAETSIYLIYQNIISNLPITIAALFVGCWLDKHENALKILLVLASFGGTVEVLLLILNAFYFYWKTKYLLIAFIPSALCGSSVYVLMAAYSYISRISVERQRPIRFAVLGLALLIGNTGGTYIGGEIIKTTPIGHDLLHNYIGVFLFSLACYIPAAIYIYFILREPKKKFKIEIIVEETTIDVIETKPLAKKDEEIEEKWYTCLKHLFEWQNVRETFVTLFKQRPNNGRMLLLTSMMSYFIIVMTTKGDSGIIFQFAQRVYNWDATTFSSYNSSASTISAILGAYIIYKLVRKYKVRDTVLAIIGVTSALLMLIARGSILSVAGYYISAVVGCLSGLSSIAFQSLLSRLIVKEDLAKIFCVTAAFQATVELIGQIVFNTIFSATVVRIPGLVYQLFTLPMFIPLVVCLAIEAMFSGLESQADEETNEKVEDKELATGNENINAPESNVTTKLTGSAQSSFGTFE